MFRYEGEALGIISTHQSIRLTEFQHYSSSVKHLQLNNFIDVFGFVSGYLFLGPGVGWHHKGAATFHTAWAKCDKDMFGAPMPHICNVPSAQHAVAV